jgi:hypothetical protein
LTVEVHSGCHETNYFLNINGEGSFTPSVDAEKTQAKSSLLFEGMKSHWFAGSLTDDCLPCRILLKTPFLVHRSRICTIQCLVTIMKFHWVVKAYLMIIQ